jgi:bifunctional ADP-heptose synthase (sugar kinase/adenylyltransferase)
MKRSVLLIGDNGLDVYQFGSVFRISPEAPVPVMVFESEVHKPGMAGNVYENLVALGLSVDFVHDKISTKTRFIDQISGQQLLRMDQDVKCSVPVIDDLNGYDMIVISDYDKGTITKEFIQDIRKRFDGPVLVDTKITDLASLDGCLVKINEREFQRCISTCDDLIVTLGGRGCRYKDRVYPSPSVSVFDVTGAGDTFLAGLAYGILELPSMDRAIEFATVGSAITVGHQGVYSPTLKEVEESEYFNHRL